MKLANTYTIVLLNVVHTSVIASLFTVTTNLLTKV